MLSLGSLKSYLLGLQVIVRGLQTINFVLESLDFSGVDTVILQYFQYIYMLSNTKMTYFGQQLGTTLLPLAALFFQTYQLSLCDIQLSLCDTYLFLGRLELACDFPELCLKFARPLGIILAISTQRSIALSENVELGDPLHKFSMLGGRSSIINSLFAFLGNSG